MSAESATKGKRASSDTGEGASLESSADELREQRPMNALLRTIECEIVPRLMMLERPSYRDPATASLRREVAQLTALLLADDASAPARFIEDLHLRGVPLDRICLELLAPAARGIVDLWEHQHCDDGELRASLNALHGILLELRGTSGVERLIQRTN